ncbi:MAG: dihydrodipicolinate reductase [Desulfobacterales bacterium]
MATVSIMINGLPGNVARMLTRRLGREEGIDLLPFSLTGPEITTKRFEEDGVAFELIRPDRRERAIEDIRARFGDFITIDFTYPSAVNSNAEFYCRLGLPFIMGTTGGDREKLEAEVKSSTIPAVIAPNMAKPIVGFQAMMEYGAERFPGLFEGYRLTVKESHQNGKADTSGTAKAVVACFNAMGVSFSTDEIQMERDPEIQKSVWGIPEEHLGGHAWHTYTLDSPDETVRLSFTHNVNGRNVYGDGVIEAVRFLSGKIEEGIGGRVFSMIDVLSGGRSEGTGCE